MIVLDKISQCLDENIPNRKSLNPNRKKAIDLITLGQHLDTLKMNEQMLAFYNKTVFTLIHSIKENFPENIYYDLDFLFFQIAKNCKNSERTFEDSLISYQTLLTKIFTLFGNRSSIKFRYIHDFIYGFDWLKWVLEKKKPEEETDPLGEAFLNYIYNRGKELEILILANDQNYPNIEDDFRNPFLFVRTSEEEEILHQTLCTERLLPLEAWDFQTIPKYDKNYSELRLHIAKKIGIDRNTMPGSHKT